MHHRLIKVKAAVSAGQPVYLCPVKARTKFNAFLVILSSVVILGFQSWWLVNSYRNELQLLVKETSIALREASFDAQFGKLLERSDEKQKDKSFLIIDDTPPPIRPREGAEKTKTQIYINISSETTTISPADGPGQNKMNWEGDSAAKRTFHLSPISESQLKSSFRQKLKEAGLDFPVIVYKTSWNDSTQQLGRLRLTAPVPAGIDHRSAYRAVIGNYTGLLLLRLWPQITVSLFIVFITLFSFVLLYRNLRNQQRLTEQKNQFISNITHELKTPIATVSVAIEAIRNFGAGDNAERRSEYLDISQKELQRLSLLVDKVLKLSMFENNKLELNREKTDLLALAREVTGSMRLQFEKANARVELETSGDDFTLDADRLHLASVMFNLLDNALKYSGEAPEITLLLRAKAQELEIEVRDNGIGIPPAYTKKIFEKFFRVPQGDRHNTKGYGLGLSYVAGIVHRHGGTIEVTSDIGKGSSFLITLPRKNG